jgi:DNA primase
MTPGKDRDAVLERLDMLALIRRYSQGEMSGPDRAGNYNMLCFLPGHHHEKYTPSLSVNVEKKLFNCQGRCGQKGSAFDLVTLMERCTFREALEILADMVGYNLEEREPDPKQEARRHRREVLTTVAEYYHKQALDSKAAKEFLATRGLPASVIEEYRLGYSPGKFPRSVTLDDLREVGLVSERDGRVWSIFRDALIFPLWKGRSCVHMTSRLIHPTGAVKHLHLPAMGTRMEAWFNERALRETSTPVIVESPLDAISWGHAGCPAVATLGVKNLNEYTIDRIPKEAFAFLGFDSDSAGVKSNYTCGKMLMAHCKETPLIIRYPTAEGVKDANDVLRRGLGKDALCEAFGAAQPFYLWVLDIHWQADAPLAKNLQIVKGVLKLVASRDPIEQDLCIQVLSERSGMDTEVLQRQLLTYLGDQGGKGDAE